MSELSSDELQELTQLAERMAKYNLEHHLAEVAYNIWSPQYATLLHSFENIKQWTIDDVRKWVSNLAFLGGDATNVTNKLYDEFIDGQFLFSIDHNTWVNKLGLKYIHFLLIEFIFHGWSFGLKSLQLPNNMNKIGVLTGVAADLSYLDPYTKAALIAADDECSDCGIGGLYGQLIVLGYKEYRSVDSSVCPFGLTNEKFLLKRRRVPNGLKIIDPLLTSTNSPSKGNYSLSLVLDHDLDAKDVSAEDRVVFEYIKDPRKDIFQIGRAIHSTNDFIVSGILHEDVDGVLSGPVSRFSCRIECERLSPFRCFIYAGGFNDNKEIVVNKVCNGQSQAHPLKQERVDGFTTFGVKIWQPETEQWLEVSVMGNTYLPRSHYSAIPSDQIASPYGNQLTNGTIIDIGGVSLVFQNPVMMARSLDINPISVLNSLNELKPQCPVLFNEIRFSYKDAKQRALKALHGESEAFSDLMPYGTLRIPLTDYSDLAEENRTFVFPACGHVHGYHKSMDSKPCPLCRTVGPFVPIAFAFEPSLCDARPTHVFNPCGHIAALKTCDYWSKIKMYSRNLPSYDMKPICPFCATDLALDSKGCGSYTKLILQTEGGHMWSSENSLEEDINQRNQIQMDSHNVVEIHKSQQLLFQREQNELLESQEYQENQLNNSSIVIKLDKMVFPKYLG